MALTYLQGSIFTELADDCTGTHAELCQWYLSGPDHTQPFYFRIYEDPSESSTEEGGAVYEKTTPKRSVSPKLLSIIVTLILTASS